MIKRLGRVGAVVGFVLALAAAAPSKSEAAPIKLGYSDWPGWVAWDVAINKGW